MRRQDQCQGEPFRTIALRFFYRTSGHPVRLLSFVLLPRRRLPCTALLATVLPCHCLGFRFLPHRWTMTCRSRLRRTIRWELGCLWTLSIKASFGTPDRPFLRRWWNPALSLNPRTHTSCMIHWLQRSRLLIGWLCFTAGCPTSTTRITATTRSITTTGSTFQCTTTRRR
ncbi:unnamed protein product [Ixodes hexagonus]